MTNILIKTFIKNYKDTGNSKVREAYGKFAGIVGIISNIVLFLFKIAVGLLSSSMSVIADAMNNLSDFASSIITLVGFKLAGKPADEEHPFGHARIEYITGIIISFVIVIIGWQLGVSSYDKIINPEPTDFGIAVYVVLFCSIFVKIWQGFFYKKIGNAINSKTVLATSKDSLNDVIASTAVLVSALISVLINVSLDAYMGLAVALYIVYSGVMLIIETSKPLLGEATDKELVNEIKQKVLSYDGIIGVHDLVVHDYGAGVCFASVHCEIDAEEDLLKSHDLIDGIERDFRREKNIQIVIHMDPIITTDEKANELKARIEALLDAVYPNFTVHDFRVVWGYSVSNVIFDIEVPFTEPKKDEEIVEVLCKIVKTLGSTYNCIIEVDRI